MFRTVANSVATAVSKISSWVKTSSAGFTRFVSQKPATDAYRVHARQVSEDVNFSRGSFQYGHVHNAIDRAKNSMGTMRCADSSKSCAPAAGRDGADAAGGVTTTY